MSTRITVVTHAVTQWNLEGKTQGHIDTPLNEYGEKMAEMLANRLKYESFDMIYSSDLRRAYETAEPLSKIAGILIQKDAKLRESRWNVKDTGEYPLLPWDISYESLAELGNRIVDAITEIAKLNDGKNLLIVTHEGVIRRFIEYLNETQNSSTPEYKSIRCAINQFVYSDGKWKCLLLNDDDYLKCVPMT